jgi:hypothetical protein
MQTNAILAPQLAAQQAYARGQSTAIQNFATALLGKLQPIAGQVGDIWNQAIGQTGDLASRAATFLQQANPTPQVQQLLQAAGAPAEQQAQLAGQLGQAYGGGAAVLNFLGGAVPGSEMATQKAAAQTQAEGYPALAALRGQQDLAGALWQQAQARNQLEAQRGQLYSTAMADIRRTQAAQAQAQGTAAYRAATLKQRGADLTEKRREFGITSQKQSARDFISFFNANKNQNYSADQWTQIAKSFGINLTGVATHAPPAKTKLTSVAPGHTVIDSNGNVVYRAPAGPTSTRPISVSPGNSLVDSTGKVIFTAPARPSTATNKPFHFKGADGREFVATPGPNGTWTTKPLGGGGAAAGGGKPMSVTQIGSYIKSIENTQRVRATNPQSGDVTTTTQTTGHKVGYQQAYRYLREHGVSDQSARDALAGSYMRGQDGRAWLTNEEQAVLRRAAAGGGAGAKRLTAVNLDPVSRHRFLSPAQYNTLRAANQLPPGAFQATPVGSRYYVAQQ